MSETFFTSDHHFGHKNIIAYCNRPFRDVDEMNHTLIQNWNAQVRSDDDIVWHLGDFTIDSAWKQGIEIARQLRGRKRLVAGNHDRCWTGHKEGYKYLPKYAEVWEIITNFARVRVENTELLLSHFPYTLDSKDEVRYAQYRLPNLGKTLVHGHTHHPWAHGNVTFDKGKVTQQIHVGVDAWHYLLVDQKAMRQQIDFVTGSSSAERQEAS